MRIQQKHQNTTICKPKKGFLAIFLVTLLLNGCGMSSSKTAVFTESTEPEVTKEVSLEEENTIQATKEEAVTPKEEEPSTSLSNNQYQIITEEYNKDNIHIKYPQLKNYTNEINQKTLNELIKNDIIDSQVNDIYETGVANDTMPLSLDLDYKITLSTSDLLSISYEGSSYIEGGAHPNNIIYGITLDLQNQKRLYLSNFTDITTDLIEKLKNAKNVSNPSLGDTNDETVIESLKTAFNNDLETLGPGFMIWSLEQQSQSNFYITDESLFVCLDVAHVLGDYAAFEIPGLNIANYNHTYDSNLCLPTENLVVRFNMKDSEKTLAVCMDKEKKYLVYRFGTKDQIEFEYPETKENSFDNFSYRHRNNVGENQSETLDTLTFQNGDYEYVVYERLANQNTFVGVKITTLSTKKETNREGDASTFAGTWYGLTEFYKDVSTTP